MSAVVQGARKLFGRSSTSLESRVDALQDAVQASRGRLPDDLVDRADQVVQRATTRLSLSGDHTVVALAGATGSGKSSTFNAITEMDLAAVGVRRPTTSWTLACVWGPEGGADPILEWLGVPARHRITHDSMLDVERDRGRGLEGLVLLDLPDHDSTEVAHHVEVERLVQFADLLVWVLDPQKYADAAIHDRFLRPLSTHADIMLVVLNHIDEVPSDRRAAMVADLRRLLDQDGLAGVPVLTTSATRGDGIGDLKAAIARRVAAKHATRDRLLDDVAVVAGELRAAVGSRKPADVARKRKSELVDALSDAAGVPLVVEAVENATRLRAAQEMGWPLTRWMARLRPDPLRRLHLDRATSDRFLARGSLPVPTATQRARVDSAVRDLADGVAAELPGAWGESVRRASTSRLGELGDALDRAVSAADLGTRRQPRWWRAVRFTQTLLFLTALAGALWLGGLALADYLRVGVPDVPEVRALPVPTLLLVGGVGCGVLIAWACRWLARLAARRRARSAGSLLRATISSVAEELVVQPVEAEVDAYRRARQALDVALGS